MGNGSATSTPPVANSGSGMLDSFFRYTGQKPGFFPEGMSGSLPGALIWTLLGAGAGRYVASPILKRLYPEYDEDRIQRASTVMGGLAGALPGAYLMYKTHQLGGPKALFGGVKNISTDPNFGLGIPTAPKTASVDSRRLLKRAAWSTLPTIRPITPAWTQPSVPFGTAEQTIDTAVASGTMGVYDAANVKQVLREARPQGSGLVSPAAIARAAVSYGIGNLAGRSLGAVANATFGSLTPGEQQGLAQGAGIGNMIFDIMGRLASG